MKSLVNQWGRKLDWVPNHDPKNWLFSVAPYVENRPAFTRLWSLPIEKHLDQGQEGKCVGYGLGHMLAAEPVPCIVDDVFATRIYWWAQRYDSQRGGAYPYAWPHYEGTDLTSGCKVILKAGGCKSFNWSFSVDTTIRTISNLGPVVHGMTMTEGMMEPDEHGFIHPTGKEVGGHCICDIGVNMLNEYFTLPQSWGLRHGINGDVKMRFKDMEKVMSWGGETAIFLEPTLITVADLPPEPGVPWWKRFLRGPQQ